MAGVLGWMGLRLKLDGLRLNWMGWLRIRLAGLRIRLAGLRINYVGWLGWRHILRAGFCIRFDRTAD